MKKFDATATANLIDTNEVIGLFEVALLHSATVTEPTEEECREALAFARRHHANAILWKMSEATMEAVELTY